MRRAVTLVVVVIACALAGCTADNTGGATGALPTAPSTTPSTALARDHKVTTFDATYVDGSRPTQPNGDFPGAPDRTIRVRFYVPEGDGAPFPLLVFSHGVTGTPEAYQLLLNDLARAGYLVAAPAYPLSNGEAPGGPTVADLGNQPADASFVIDRVLADAQAPGPLHGLVDPERIGVAGHSLGGFTTLELAFNSTCADPRIKAVVILSAGIGGCAGTHFTGTPRPVLVVHGDDETVPYKYGKEAFDAAPSPKFMLTILGGAHSSEALGGTTPRQRALTGSMIAFFDHYLRGAPLDALPAAATHPGLTTFAAQP
jgi:dienelactone hydrolase